MIVDDEPDIANSFKKGLELHGFQVDVFIDPVLALANFLPALYDGVVLDVRMPELNGFELYRELRKIDGKTSFFFMSAYDGFGDELGKVLADNAQKTFLKKPISIAQLEKALRESFAMRL